MRTFDIVLKDLAQILRDRKSLLFLVAMPVIFTLFMGFAYKDSAAPVDPRLAVAWIDNDGGAASQALHAALLKSDSVRLVEMAAGHEADANQQVATGKLSAAMIVPAGFSQQVLAPASDAARAQIALVADPTSVTGQSALQILRVPVTRLMSAAAIARAHVAGLPAGTVDPDQELAAAFQQANSLWQASAQDGAQVVVEKAQRQTAGKVDLQGNPYNQSSPGILVMFAIFSLVTSATIVVQERKNRTLDRMITTALPKAQIIAGHLLAMFVLIMLQQVLLVVFGQLLLKVDYLRQPLGTLLVMVGLALWVAAVGLFIGVIAKAEEQVTLFAMVAMFIFSALGGAWFSLESSGGAFAFIGRLTPAAFAMQGFQDILIRGLDTPAVLLPAGVLVAYAAAFFVLAVWRFQKAL
jgi:ABC-2 type transport system permease protein